MTAVLCASDLAFFNLIAARRLGQDAQPAEPANLEAAVAWPDTVEEGLPKFPTPQLRAASQAEAVLRVFAVAPRITALLAMSCRLRLEGHELIAPQGVLAAMIDGLARGRVDTAALGRWLVDRSVEVH